MVKILSKGIDILSLGGMTDMKSKVQDGELIEDLSKKRIKLSIKPQATTSAIVFNCTVKPFKDNITLRRAMSLAYDRAKDVYLLCNDTVQIAKSFLPPILKGGDDNIDNKYVYYNLEEAKKLMIEAGYPQGKGLEPITLDIVYGTVSNQRATLVQKFIAELGIDIVISVNSWSEFLRKAREGNTQMHFIGWMPAIPDASNFLQNFYKEEENHLDWGGYNNKKYNKLYEESLKISTPAKRIDLYKSMAQILSYDVPNIFLHHSKSIHVYYEWVRNFEYFFATPCTYFQYLDIDMAAKNAK